LTLQKGDILQRTGDKENPEGNIYDVYLEVVSDPFYLGDANGGSYAVSVVLKEHYPKSSMIVSSNVIKK